LKESAVFYTALHRDEFIFSNAGLDAVLAFVADCNEPQFGEDAVVWCGGRVVAVCRADGAVVRLDGPPAPLAAPADLVDAGEAVEDAA
jgi:hypothetical protein